jgi:hypothetical protein
MDHTEGTPKACDHDWRDNGTATIKRRGQQVTVTKQTCSRCQKDKYVG